MFFLEIECWGIRKLKQQLEARCPKMKNPTRAETPKNKISKYRLLGNTIGRRAQNQNISFDILIFGRLGSSWVFHFWASRLELDFPFCYLEVLARKSKLPPGIIENCPPGSFKTAPRDHSKRPPGIIQNCPPGSFKTTPGIIQNCPRDHSKLPPGIIQNDPRDHQNCM